MERIAYNKVAQKKPIGTGYDRRTNGAKPTTAVVHSTNGNRGSSFEGECTYLLNADGVGAHFVVGKKRGQMAEIVPPELRAWHVGVVFDEYRLFGNNYSLGFELHHAVGERYPDTQFYNLTDLMQTLMVQYDIVPAEIETHRRVAKPKGRKVDPSDWLDAAFYSWRSSLAGEVERPLLIERDAQVVGSRPRIDIDQWRRALIRNGPTGLSASEMDYVYAHSARLEVDPAFLLALWVREGGRPLGSSPLQQQTHQPINIKAAAGEWRPTVAYNGEQWHKFETPFLGLLGSVLHLKNVYGQLGKLTLEGVIAHLAPPAENDTERYIAEARKDITYMMTA